MEFKVVPKAVHASLQREVCVGFYFFKPTQTLSQTKNPCGNFPVIFTPLTLDNVQVLLKKINTAAFQYREAGVHTEHAVASLPKAHVDAWRTRAQAASEQVVLAPYAGAGVLTCSPYSAEHLLLKHFEKGALFPL